MIRARALFLAATLCSSAAPAAADAQPVQVRIENTTGEAIRCVAVLAHFVTRTLSPIVDGETREITLGRDPNDGSLSYGSHDGDPMLLENLLCGTVSDWTASARDLPILQLRGDRAIQFEVRCALERRKVLCSPL